MLAQAESETAETTQPVGGSFAALVQEHQSMVYSLAWNSLQDQALAEEVAQEVFLELYRRLDTFESQGHVKNWLRRVAINRCIDQSRRRKIRPQLGLEDVREPAAPGALSDPLMEARVQRVVASLPERLRSVVVLRYQEDLDPADIAEVLDIPIRTVKSRLHRSLEMLRAKLGPQDNERGR